jgi:hypothetical protein
MYPGVVCGWTRYCRRPTADLHITNAPMAGGRITIDISGSTTSVQGQPEGMVLHRGHRPWMTELVEQATLRKEA